MTETWCPALRPDEQDLSNFSAQLESLAIDDKPKPVGPDSKPALKYDMKDNPLSARLEMFGLEITPEILEEGIFSLSI
jgi:hypothetical protein